MTLTRIEVEIAEAREVVAAIFSPKEAQDMPIKDLLELAAEIRAWDESCEGNH